ncbi:diguanylate cyclase domain-containing protein [Rhodoferax sp.]|uniref:GGDEF domain-containing protein n=1 Tax=Rhodoferax sp. TaxID=50421 RepID=UPI00374DF1C1
MMKPPIPPDDHQRVATLRSLNLLDTPREERFDRLTRLAKRIFGVSMALVSFVDQNRQWFKSADGMDVRETSRDVSFCAHAILSDDGLVVPDALEDTRFADNPLVTSGPHIRFYAGWPLLAQNGSKLGTLCILDPQPKEFGAEDLRLLGDLAHMAEQEISIHQLDTTDHRTKLYNPRGFKVLAQHAMNMAERENKSCSLAYFGLDRFRAINEGFGYAEGDKALMSFAEQMRRTFRGADILARMDGDKFVALLFDCTSAPSQRIVQRLVDALERRNQFSQSGYALACSYAILDVALQDHPAIETLLQRAEALMLENKRRRAVA